MASKLKSEKRLMDNAKGEVSPFPLECMTELVDFFGVSMDYLVGRTKQGQCCYDGSHPAAQRR